MPRRLVIVGGPNGAGKTTFAKGYLQVYPYKYLSADALAEELSPGQPSLAKIEAGREFSRQVKESLSAGEDLVLESTLSGRSLQRVLRQARDGQYSIHLVFVFLEAAQTCVDRVRERVQKGGHDVPEVDVRRRFYRSKTNFWDLYRYEAEEWHLFDNSSEAFQQAAFGTQNSYEILDETLFAIFTQDFGASDEE